MSSSNAPIQSTGLALLPPPPPPPSSRKVRRSKLQTPALDNIEDVYMYKPGGHHPVNLGDVLGQRFKVVHKLGNGGFALVWLARDLEQNQNVALKVLRADAPYREIDTLKRIQERLPKITQVVNLHETFTIHGPNGIHQCLVVDVGGPSLHQLSLYCKWPDLSFLKKASRNLAEGLAALHSAGICHGDLTHSNVLFEIKGFHNWTENQIYDCFGPPQTAPLLLANGLPAPPFAPAHVVSALNHSRLSVDQLSSNILIIDFGEAFSENNVPKDLGTPASFYAPEMLFKYPPSFAADLWALGCLIFEIHTSNTLLPTPFGSTLEALALAMETIGALPGKWLEFFQDTNNILGAKLDQNDRWFDDSIERTRTFDDQILRWMPNLSREQHDLFVELLKSIMVFEPACRLSANEIRAHSWFNEG